MSIYIYTCIYIYIHTYNQLWLESLKVPIISMIGLAMISQKMDPQYFFQLAQPLISYDLTFQSFLR